MNLFARLLPTAAPRRNAGFAGTAATAAAAAAAAGLLLLLGASHPAAAQNFAVGAGGVIVNDSAAAKSVSAFGTGGFLLFGEVHLERSTTIQVRGGSFSLPPSDVGGPNVKADHLELLAQYLFDWEWFRAGFIGGVGVVRMTPKALEPGQVEIPNDVQQNAFTLMGGVVTRFPIVKDVDLRIEGDFYYFNSKADRVPITIAATVAYSF